MAAGAVGKGESPIFGMGAPQPLRGSRKGRYAPFGRGVKNPFFTPHGAPPPTSFPRFSITDVNIPTIPFGIRIMATTMIRPKMII